MLYENDIPFLTDHPEAIKSERKPVSGLFFSLTLAMALAYVVVMAVYGIMIAVYPNLSENELVSLLVNDSYTVVAILLFSLFSKSHKLNPPKYTVSLSFGKMLVYMVISISLMAIGALIGQAVNAFIEMISGITVYNGVEDMVQSYGKFEIILAAVIIAPITEELLFRKLLVDKLSRFGTKFCVVISGITFGVFHGNFYQFFYGVALGMLLAYIYCVHGKLRYTIILHALINLLGSVVSLYAVEFAESGNILRMMLASLYSIAYISCIPAGAILLVLEYKKTKHLAVQGILISPFKTLIKNKGFIFFILYAIAMFVFNIFIS